ncbi:MAG: glycolate oxidase subunit GlcE [Gammaproteobacteria bacterium]|nr:glycolate oxidase subunit GlcE [Gammaproteobacteria bacterium]
MDNTDNTDHSQQLAEQIAEAAASGRALCIQGGNSKAFYGRLPQGEPLSVAAHRGVVSYDPTELVITARAGTPLKELVATLRAENQMLPFEPPGYGENATLGGSIACNFSGPRRAYAGAARDFVLGTRVINGRGEQLRFGGEVMKNVAGYDASRLMCGALGTLGLILEVSLKVLPLPEAQASLVFELDPASALARMQALARQPWPLSASCYLDGRLHLRLSGTAGGVSAARQKLGGELLADDEGFWAAIREHHDGFFAEPAPLWRISLDAAAPPLPLAGESIYEWGGALRWLRGEQDMQALRALAQQYGGHATLFRHGASREHVFQPLSPGLLALHRQLKQAFDPVGILNPGRLYSEF